MLEFVGINWLKQEKIVRLVLLIAMTVSVNLHLLRRTKLAYVVQIVLNLKEPVFLTNVEMDSKQAMKSVMTGILKGETAVVLDAP